MATRPTKLPLPMAADLYGDIEPSPKATWRGYWPGLAIVAAGTLAAGFLSDHYGVPLTLMALLIGLALAAALGHRAGRRADPRGPDRRAWT